jgi:PAS domain S-box-containing protein
MLERIRVLFYSGITLIFVMSGVVAASLYDARNSVRNAAEQQLNNLALTLERDIGRSLTAFDLSIRASVSGMSTPGLTTLDRRVRQAILFDGAIKAEGYRGVFITNAAGDNIYDSLGDQARPINISDRPFFRAHQAQDNLGLIISPPLLSHVTGRWVLALTRRINHPDGTFAGVAVGTIELDWFQSLFSALNVGKHGIINLVTSDGVLLARRPNGSSDLGRDMRGSVLFHYLAQASSGTFETNSLQDGERRLYAYRQIANLPIIVGVGFQLHEIYAAWVTKALILGGVMLIVAGFAVASVVGLRRELVRRTLAERAAAEAGRQHMEALARLDALFKHSVDSMVIASVQPGGSFTYEAVNPVWHQLTGVAVDKAIGRSPEECLPSGMASPILTAWHTCFRERRAVPFVFTVQNGPELREWEASVAPVIDASGVVKRLISVGRDVTERNRLEANLRQSQRMEAVGQLTAGVAHDFNNLLQAIIGALELAQDRPELDAQRRNFITVAESAASRASTLVHRLLAFSRKQPLKFDSINPVQIFSDISALLVSALGGRVKVVTKADDGVWPVHADAGQLENCLVNLVVNARDAMPAGGMITIRAFNATPAAVQNVGLPRGDYVCFTVQDEGIGMSADVIARALEPFFTTKELGKGTGLGLSMVHGFARQSGGELRLDSTAGRGTIVSLWLPRAHAVTHDAGWRQPPSSAFLNLGTSQVVLVEDEESVREMLSHVLVQAGFTPVAFARADAALQFLQSGQPCVLLITDQSMPGMKGSELITEVMRLWPNLPALLITGFDKVNGLEEGDGRFTILQKPFRRNAFLEQIQTLLHMPLECGEPPYEVATEESNVVVMRHVS